MKSHLRKRVNILRKCVKYALYASNGKVLALDQGGGSPKEERRILWQVRDRE